MDKVISFFIELGKNNDKEISHDRPKDNTDVSEKESLVVEEPKISPKSIMALSMDDIEIKTGVDGDVENKIGIDMNDDEGDEHVLGCNAEVSGDNDKESKPNELEEDVAKQEEKDIVDDSPRLNSDECKEEETEDGTYKEEDIIAQKMNNDAEYQSESNIVDARNECDEYEDPNDRCGKDSVDVENKNFSEDEPKMIDTGFHNKIETESNQKSSDGPVEESKDDDSTKFASDLKNNTLETVDGTKATSGAESCQGNGNDTTPGCVNTDEVDKWQDNEKVDDTYCKEVLKLEQREMQPMKVAESTSDTNMTPDDEECVAFTTDSHFKTNRDEMVDVQQKGQKTREGSSADEDDAIDGNDDTTEQQSVTIDCGSLGLEVAHVVLLLFMSISFLSGACLMISDSHYLEETNLLFIWLVGALCYVGATCIDITKRMAKGSRFETFLGLIAMLAGISWFVGSIFLFRNMFNSYLFGGLFGCGSLLNLFVITLDIIFLFKSNHSKSVFRLVSLVLAWLGNLLFIGGSQNLLVIVEHWYCCTGAEGAVGALIAGSVVYFVSSVCQVLSLSMNDYVISIEVSRMPSRYSQIPRL